jgi:hypothetical protein
MSDILVTVRGLPPHTNCKSACPAVPITCHTEGTKIERLMRPDRGAVSPQLLLLHPVSRHSVTGTVPLSQYWPEGMGSTTYMATYFPLVL